MKKIAPIQECFGIDISVQDSKPLIDLNKKTIFRLKTGSRFSIDNPVKIDADPFLFVHKGWLFLFYEDMHYYGNGGNIAMVKTNDLVHWSKPVNILDDNYHYSFPFIFEDEGNVYLIPETGCNNTVRLYKANNDNLDSFSLVTNIFEQPERPKGIVYNFCDNVLYKKEGVYYLFTSTWDSIAYKLELYISDKLEGPYKAHPSSPIRYDNKYGRNGGPLIEHEGKLFRVAQDCEETYGGDVHLLEIDEMTPTSYKEHVYKENLMPKDQPYYKDGGHQLSFAEFKGKTIIATDAKNYRRFYLLKGWHKLLRGLRLSEY